MNIFPITCFNCGGETEQTFNGDLDEDFLTGRIFNQYIIVGCHRCEIAYLIYQKDIICNEEKNFYDYLRSIINPHLKKNYNCFFEEQNGNNT